MKIISNIALFVLLWLPIIGRASDYPYFITDDDHVYQNATNGEHSIRPEKIIEAKRADDSKPEAAFPEGNWGEPKFGSRVSIRVAKKTYTTNEPITAILLVRNVGDQETSVSFRPPVVANYIVVIGPNGEVLQHTDVPIAKNARQAALLTMAAKADECSIPSGMQRKFEVDLREHLSLTLPGQYTIYAAPRVLDHAINKYVEIQSGRVSFVITNSLGSLNPKSR